MPARSTGRDIRTTRWITCPSVTAWLMRWQGRAPNTSRRGVPNWMPRWTQDSSCWRQRRRWHMDNEEGVLIDPERCEGEDPPYFDSKGVELTTDDLVYVTQDVRRLFRGEGTIIEKGALALIFSFPRPGH